MTFIQYYETMILPDGVYNGKYNKEPALIRIKEGKPIWVQFIGFMKNDEPTYSSIYNAKGILSSSVEILVPSQKI